MENRLSDLWAILDWTTPGLLGQLEAFIRKVAVLVERYRDAEATTRFAALLRPFPLRRKKTDPGIAPELPRKTETDQIVPLTAEQVTLYEAVVRETLEAIKNAEGIERAGLVFKLLTALKQICNHPAQYLKQSVPLAGRSGKLAAFDELSDVILASGESMLVFTQYTQMATLLQQHLDARGIRSLYLHGGVPVRRREEMVDRFQAGDVPVFLLSLKAGGTGLTLTRATDVLHYDRWWNPAVEDQATDRAYRIGQDRLTSIGNWEMQAGDPAVFAFRVAFLPNLHGPRDRAAPQERESWGSFSIWVHGENACAHTSPSSTYSAADLQ